MMISTISLLPKPQSTIDLDADFSGSETILRLFAKSGSEGAPARLTDWDSGPVAIAGP
jgi:hypothetical protein